MSENPADIPELEALNFLNYGAEPDLVNAAVSHVRSVLPEWEPRAGNTEMVLLESMAVMLGPNILAVQMLAGQIVEQLMSLYGIVRSEGQRARVQLLVEVTNSSPTQTIPAGTRFRYTVEQTGETIDFVADESLEIITSETLAGALTATAEDVGTAANSLPLGAVLHVVDPLPFVEAATSSSPATGGTGPETEAEFQGRAAAVLARLTSTLVLPEHFSFAALAEPEIGRAKVLDLYNPAATPKTGQPGHVTVAVAGKDGQPVSQETMDLLAASMAEQALASLTIHIIEPTYTPVDIAVTVKAAPGYDPEVVRSSVAAALQAWLSPARWDWAAAVTQYAVVAVVAAVPGVREVITAPATQQLLGDAPLPQIGAITVTVQ
ncbi:baseplate J/gp47 family protein [Arthrobacter sulfonylureivorans]|uniref:baseplate J/gp47 family protein n=1 Tax=Arthrobacter sulfonylureivorans TaxID=2486855 RepID=UPI0039E53A3B